MTRQLRRSVLILCIGCAGQAGCTPPSGDRPPATPEFGEIATEVRHVPLEHSELALIGDLGAIAPRPDGNILALDRMTMRVLEFDAEGGFLRWKGRPGDGPGEFRSPAALALLPDGDVLVAGFSRITRLSRDLEFEENLPVDNSAPFRSLYVSDEGVVLGAQSHRSTGFVFSFLDPDTGELTDPFVERHPDLLSVPYWNALFATELTEFRDRFVVSHNMVYPIHVYDTGGTLVDSLASPPASWVEAPRPERGEFASPAAQRGFDEWRRGFTIMAGIFAVQDRWLVVPHRVFRDGSDDPEYRLDLYDTAFRKRYTDVRSPGKPIRGGECLWVITVVPPDQWTLSCFTFP